MISKLKLKNRNKITHLLVKTHTFFDDLYALDTKIKDVENKVTGEVMELKFDEQIMKVKGEVMELCKADSHAQWAKHSIGLMSAFESSLLVMGDKLDDKLQLMETQIKETNDHSMVFNEALKVLYQNVMDMKANNG